MKEFIESTVEFQNWGTNKETLVFLVTVLFTMFQGWSLFSQGITVHRKRSGESLSVVLFIYGASYFFTFFAYGITRGSVAIMFNGLLGVPCLVVLLSLIKFKGLSKGDRKILMVLPLMIPLAYLLRGVPQDTLVLVGLLGLLFPMLDQVREIQRTKRPGSVDPRFLLTFMAASLFWFLFGLYGGGWIFLVFNPLSFIILGATLVLYIRYKKEAPSQRV